MPKVEEEKESIRLCSCSGPLIGLAPTLLSWTTPPCDVDDLVDDLVPITCIYICFLQYLYIQRKSKQHLHCTCAKLYVLEPANRCCFLIVNVNLSKFVKQNLCLLEKWST